MNRLGFIGGSDIAAILGVSSYKTAYQLYLEKLGLAQQDEETEWQYWGKTLEPLVRERFKASTGFAVTQPDAIVHPQYPFLVGHLDGFIEQENAVLEIKCASAFMRYKWADDAIPLDYLLQVAFYCALKGCDKAYFAVLFGGNTYEQRVYEHDRKLGEQIIEAAVQFWWHIEMQIPPRFSGVADLTLHYPKSVSQDVVATADVLAEVECLKIVKRQIALLEIGAQASKAAIMRAMGENDTLRDEQGLVLATWKTRKDGKRIFQLKGMSDEN